MGSPGREPGVRGADHRWAATRKAGRMWCRVRWEDATNGCRQGVGTGPEPLRRPFIFDPRRGSSIIQTTRDGPRVSPGATHIRPACRGSFPRRQSPCWKLITCNQGQSHQRAWVTPGASPGFVAPIIVRPRPAKRVEGGAEFEMNPTGDRSRNFEIISDPPSRPILFDPRRGSPRLTAGRTGPRVSPGATHVRPACRGSFFP